MRKCKDCEYYHAIPGYDPDCWFDPPTVAAGMTSSLISKNPKIEPDHYCSKWEPKWEDNEVLNKAWKEFQLILKMTKEGL